MEIVLVVGKVFVLWTWMALPWNFGPMPMTPGWWSSMTFMPPNAEVDCREAKYRSMIVIRNYPAPSAVVVCLQAGEEPSPIARRDLQKG